LPPSFVVDWLFSLAGWTPIVHVFIPLIRINAEYHVSSRERLIAEDLFRTRLTVQPFRKNVDILTDYLV